MRSCCWRSSDVRVDWRFVALGLLGVVINFEGARAFWAHVYPPR